ncbi:glycosyltransferase [Denitratisoma oestradiolicum]|uniref:Glycosyl transferase family 1 domain-containing protein n=1 Tax=Denitratisoma oestradiolicum TaxID=311182 RepID=A0A6S6Y681_9PROT|nr:glycosyltransferase [Denitratisoma oestradiolicum]CAB1371089.1 conserved protein of unknown function [Denitratisoma oestradiolicum]
MTGKAIHQFHPSCAPGDGVTNGMLFTRRLLRDMGFASEIYCDHIPSELAAIVRPRQELDPAAGAWLLVHHSLGYEDDAWLARFAGRAVLVYHNITPTEMLPAEGPWRDLARLGRTQLTAWKPWFAGALGDSTLNVDDLRVAGYETPRVLPLLVDLHTLQTAPWEADILGRYQDTTNILFVGRLAPNKRHDLLLDAFAEYLHHGADPACLILPGKAQDAAWQTHLEDRAEALGIRDQVDFLGPVSDNVLRGLYRAADVFCCVSDHEGFGMPLIEAALFDVPVLARAVSGVPDTLGEGGLLTDSDDPRTLGALMHLLLDEPGLRRRVLAGQQANLTRFHPGNLGADLADFLTGLGLAVPRPPERAAAAVPRWRVEGPFDSSYSLALVNRETARALVRQGQTVALSPTPGSGEPDPDPGFLARHPDMAALVHAAGRPGATDVTLRFTYPPRCDAMVGRVRAVHAYGWEETGFPARYVRWFNRKLDLITVLSREVRKTLQDAGVRVPIAVVGAGVDQWAAPENTGGLSLPPLGKSYRFLHISSAFPRKGVDVLLAAYGKAFRADDDVTLVIKTFPNPHNDVSEQLTTLRRRDPGYPDVVLINEDWPDARIAALYSQCQAFVAPARGEGLGLPMAEAMRFGLPVITTAWGGQTDFCTPETAWLIDYHFAPSRSHLDADHSAWAEPDADHLAALMTEVRQAPAAVLAPRLRAARERVAREYTWDRMAERTRAAVMALDRLPAFRPQPRVAWVSSWNTRCGIATYSGYLSAAIPDDRLRVYASRDGDPVAEDKPNVTRCWDTGLHGTLDELRAALARDKPEALVIQYNYGFFPLAQLAALSDDQHRRGGQTHLFLHATQDVDKPDFKASLREIVPALGRMDRIYVHGHDDLDRLRALGLATNTTLFPHGIPLPEGVPDAGLRAARGLTDKRVIASYGFLLPHKGQRQLLEAFALLAEKHPDLHLVLSCALYPVAESFAERETIEAMAKQAGITDRVHLITDFLPDAESFSWLQLADLVVYPYQHTQESASGAVRMGLACGRPVAVTPLSIFDDVDAVVHRLPGISPEQMARGIEALLADPVRLASRQAAADRYRAARAWPALARRFLDIVDALANALPEPDDAAHG